MTERERLTRIIADTQRIIERHEQDVREWREHKEKHESELAALPPEEIDLSPWKPKGGDEFWYLDTAGDAKRWRASYNSIRGHTDWDRNIYRTEAEAEAAAKYLRLCERLHQMHVALYGVEGWEPGDTDYGAAIFQSRDKSKAFIAHASLHCAMIGQPIFKTKEDAELVLAQLQKEGIA